MLSVEQLTASLPARFKLERWNGKTTTVYFGFSEPQALKISICVSNNGVELIHGELPNADCIVNCTGENYVRMELGELNPQWALVSGKVKVSNVAVLIEFTKWFSRIKPADEFEKIGKNMRPELSGPLKGIRVIDFSRLLPGPFASLLMADMGAEVIKLEDVDSPDPMRQFMPIINGVSAFYEALNRNKKSLAFKGITSEESKNKIFKLIETTDVIIEGFRPGVIKKMGFDYETCKAINPKVIYISISGYGQSGPMANLAGHDLNYMAMSGMLGLIPNGNMPSFQAADLAGSYAALSSILAALLNQKINGIGAFIDLSMTEAVMPLGILAQTQYQHNPSSFELSGEMPNYRVYAASDNQYIALAALEPKFWERFCAKADKNHLLNIYSFSKDEITNAHLELEDYFRGKSKDQWIKWADNQDICLTPVLNFEEVKRNPQFIARKIINPTAIFSNSIHFEGKQVVTGWQAPKLGEDNHEFMKSH